MRNRPQRLTRAIRFFCRSLLRLLERETIDYKVGDCVAVVSYADIKSEWESDQKFLKSAVKHSFVGFVVRNDYDDLYPYVVEFDEYHTSFIFAGCELVKVNL